MSKKILSVLLAVLMLLTVIPLAFVSANTPGDVDGDGEIKAADARLVLRASVDLEDLNEIQIAAADVDGIPGIKASDARLILRASVGLETLHTHEYKEESIITAATCDKDGEKKLSCECGDFITEAIPAAGHKEEKLPETPATCTETGLTEGKKCSVCNKIIVAQKEIAAKGHTEITLKAAEATCTEAGLTEGKKCSVCGEITKAQATVPAKGHTEITLPAVPATCTKTGLTEGKKCSVCGEITVAQATVPVKAHAMGSWTVSSPASCTASGTEKRVCSDCGYEETREIAALTHTLITLPAVEATCTETGFTEGKKCSVCGEITVAQTVVPAKGHTETVLPAVPATCTETGLTEGKKCSVCGEITVAQTTAPAKGHTETVLPAVEATCTETGLTEGKKCSVCGEILVAQTAVPVTAHTEILDEASVIEVTCKENGYTGNTVCSVCGTVLSQGEEIISTGEEHDWTEVTVPATCGQPGYKITQCSVCELNDNDTYVETEPAKDHVWGEAVVTAPTCTEEGFSESTCTVCGAVEKTDFTEASGHSFKWDDSKTVKATCITEGSKTGTCTVCGEETTESLPLTGHTEGAPVYETDPCFKVVSCSVCNEELSRTEFHKIKQDRYSKKSATCTTPATYDNYCENCTAYGDHINERGYSVKTIFSSDALGHLATKDLTKSYDATCEKDGKWVYSGTCSREGCGAVLDNTEIIIKAKGHNLTGEQTCTTDVVCSNSYCDFENGVVLERFGHDNKLTTAAYGKTVSTFYCARCGEETEDKLDVFNEIANSIKTPQFYSTYTGNKNLTYFRKTSVKTSYSRFDFGMFTSAIRDMYEQEMANTPDEYTRIYDNGSIRLTLPIESTYPNYVTSALTSSDIDSISVERLSGAKMAQILADYNPPYTNEAQIARLAAIKAVNVNEPVIKVTVDVKNEKYSQIKALPDTEKTSLEKIFDLNIRNDANDFKNENGELKQTVTESGDGFNITMTMNLREIASDGQVTYYFRESTYEPIVAIYNANITMEQAIDMTFKIGVFSLNGKMDPIVDSTYSYVYLFPNYSAK